MDAWVYIETKEGKCTVQRVVWIRNSQWMMGKAPLRWFGHVERKDDAD